MNADEGDSSVDDDKNRRWVSLTQDGQRKRVGKSELSALIHLCCYSLEVIILRALIRIRQGTIMRGKYYNRSISFILENGC